MLKQLALFLCLVSLCAAACNNGDVPELGAPRIEAPAMNPVEAYYHYWNDLSRIDHALFMLQMEVDRAAHRRLMAQIKRVRLLIERHNELNRKDIAECRAILRNHSKTESAQMDLLACAAFLDEQIEWMDKILSYTAHRP